MKKEIKNKKAQVKMEETPGEKGFYIFLIILIILAIILGAYMGCCFFQLCKKIGIGGLCLFP